MGLLEITLATVALTLSVIALLPGDSTVGFDIDDVPPPDEDLAYPASSSEVVGQCVMPATCRAIADGLIHGAQGARGPQGIEGKPGKDGRQGDDGPPGPAGRNGVCSPTDCGCAVCQHTKSYDVDAALDSLAYAVGGELFVRGSGHVTSKTILSWAAVGGKYTYGSAGNKWLMISAVAPGTGETFPGLSIPTYAASVTADTVIAFAPYGAAATDPSVAIPQAGGLLVVGPIVNAGGITTTTVFVDGHAPEDEGVPQPSCPHGPPVPSTGTEHSVLSVDEHVRTAQTLLHQAYAYVPAATAIGDDAHAAVSGVAAYCTGTNATLPAAMAVVGLNNTAPARDTPPDVLEVVAALARIAQAATTRQIFSAAEVAANTSLSELCDVDALVAVTYASFAGDTECVFVAVETQVMSAKDLVTGEYTIERRVGCSVMLAAQNTRCIKSETAGLCTAGGVCAI